MQAASDFVSYINDSLKPQDGKAYEIQTRGLGFLDGSHHILVEIAKVGALPGLFLILSTYVKAKLNAKIKIKRGTNRAHLRFVKNFAGLLYFFMEERAACCGR